VERAAFHSVDELPVSTRGAGGHGSTGGHDALAAGSLTGAPTRKAEK
jgi:dUTP diphosphatase